MSFLIRNMRFAEEVVGVVDTFTRANSTTSLGVADTGETWTAHVGTWGVLDGHGYLPTPVGDDHASLDTLMDDFDMSFDIMTAANDLRNPGITFRDVDDANFLLFMLQPNPDAVFLFEKVAGSYTQLATAAWTGAASTQYTLRVVAVGTSIECYVDTVLLMSHSTSRFQNATRVGMRIASLTDGWWDDLLVVAA